MQEHVVCFQYVIFDISLIVLLAAVIIGGEPGDLSAGLGLSRAVSGSVDAIIEMVLAEIGEAA